MEHTAQRPGDARAMEWPQYDGKRIKLVQEKTGKLLSIPAHANLRAALDEARHDGVTRIGGHIVAQPNGKRFSESTAVRLFDEVREGAKLRHLQARDLRRTACVRLTEAGCTDFEISAISGHSIEMTRRILETYVPRTENMGNAGMAKWERNEAKMSNALDSDGG